MGRGCPALISGHGVPWQLEEGVPSPAAAVAALEAGNALGPQAPGREE